MQPAYRKGEEDVELVLLSFPNTLKDSEKVIKEIYKKVYGRWKFAIYTHIHIIQTARFHP